MRGRIVVAVLAVLLLGVGAAWWLLSGEGDDSPSFQGYVEGNLVYVAAEEGGRIETLTVDSGDRVAAGQALVALESSMQVAQRNEAEARWKQAQAQLADLSAALQRPEQIAVLRAQEQRATAQLQLSQNDFQRQQTLFERGITAKAQLDQARSAFDRDTAAQSEAQRQIRAAEMSGRSGEIAGAEASARAAEAALRQAETRLAKRRVSSPANAKVQDVFFRTGEVVASGQPILSLLPPENLRIRFYVPEPVLSTVALGQRVGLVCDNCPDGRTAKISFLSREAEYTPPVIFSEQERAKLVFRAEARPEGGLDLPIGLPIAVRPMEAGR